MISEVEIRTAKQNLRVLLANIVTDFDRHGGAFGHLDYQSPWIAATEMWADRSSRTIDELRQCITEVRTARILGHRLDDSQKFVFEDFRRAVETWRSDTGYIDPPLHRTASDMRFPNYRELKDHVSRSGMVMGLSDAAVTYSSGDLTIGGFLHDRFGHRVYVTMTIKLRYGGKISLDFRFPYFEPGDPARLSSGELLASAVRHDLKLPGIPELEWVAGKSPMDFKELDRATGIASAIISYLRPTIH